MDIASLSERLTRVEDRLAILDLLAGSAISSDTASETFWADMFTDDAVMDRGGAVPDDVGRENLLAIVRSPSQRAAIDAGMAHLAMMPTIAIDGDRATATGYLLIVVPDTEARAILLPGKGSSAGIGIYQVTVNRWELVRTADGWRVSRRVVRALAADDSRSILARGIDRGDGATI
ncbi:hypothetical protein BH09PSE3_BH09PSE3_28350 [soil metagenome]